MDHLRTMGFLLLLFTTTLFALQFAEARDLEHHFHNAALSQHNSLDLDTVAMASSRANYSGSGEHVTNYSESNTGSSSGNSTHAAYNTIITVELLQKDAAPGDGSGSRAPEGIKEVAPIEGNEEILHEILNLHSSPGVGHMSVNGGMEDNILSASGQSPGVGHWEKSISKSKPSWPSPARTTPNSVLSSGPSPGVGNGHTSAISGTQSESGTFNKLPSGSSPGVGHKVTTGNTEMAQESESKKSATMMNILPSGPSPGVGHSATNGRNMIEKISTESESKKEIAFTQESESKKISEFMNILPSGPSPGVGHSATNGRNTMEKMTKKDEGAGMGIIKTFNKLPSGPSPGVGHSYSNALLPDKIPRATRGSEDTKGSDHSPIIHKLPGGPSPGGGHSYVEKSASTVRMQLSSNAVLIKSSSSPSRGDGNSSENKLRPARRNQKQTGGALDQKIGCDGGGLDFYGTLSPPMFGIAAGRS